MSTAIPRPAATIVLTQSGAPGEPDAVYLVKRHNKSGFMASMYVFPGGRVDDADAAIAAPHPAHAWPDLDAAAAHPFAIAAIRETLEEAGVLLARHADGRWADGFQAEAAFRAVHAGTPFSDVLSEAGLSPAVDALKPLAWWLTPTAEPRRYDTRFFTATVPPAQNATIDDHEVVHGQWLTAVEALSAYADGTVNLAPPTFVTLEDLAAARTTPLALLCPVIDADDTRTVFALPGDALHPEKARAFPHRTRVTLPKGGRLVSEEVPA